MSVPEYIYTEIEKVNTVIVDGRHFRCLTILYLYRFRVRHVRYTAMPQQTNTYTYISETATECPVHASRCDVTDAIRVSGKLQLVFLSLYKQTEYSHHHVCGREFAHSSVVFVANVVCLF